MAVRQFDSDGFEKLGIDGKLVNVQGEGVWVDADGTLYIKLGDASGVQKVSILDSADNEVASFNSDGTLTSVGLAQTAAGELTLDTDGEITIGTGCYYSVDTFEDAATDDLVLINGGVAGQIIVIHSANSARDVTVKETGNLHIDGDFVIDRSWDRMMLMCSEANHWMELSRADNG